jgi:hypothetical protein
MLQTQPLTYKKADPLVLDTTLARAQVIGCFPREGTSCHDVTLRENVWT